MSVANIIGKYPGFHHIIPDYDATSGGGASQFLYCSTIYCSSIQGYSPMPTVGTFSLNAAELKNVSSINGSSWGGGGGGSGTVQAYPNFFSGVTNFNIGSGGWTTGNTWVNSNTSPAVVTYVLDISAVFTPVNDHLVTAPLGTGITGNFFCDIFPWVASNGPTYTTIGSLAVAQQAVIAAGGSFSPTIGPINGNATGFLTVAPISVVAAWD